MKLAHWFVLVEVDSDREVDVCWIEVEQPEATTPVTNTIAALFPHQAIGVGR